MKTNIESFGKIDDLARLVEMLSGGALVIVIRLEDDKPPKPPTISGQVKPIFGQNQYKIKYRRK